MPTPGSPAPHLTKPPGLTHWKPCRTFGLAQNKMITLPDSSAWLPGRLVAIVGYGIAGCLHLTPDVVRRAGGLILDGGGGVDRCGLDRLGCLPCWVLEAGHGVLGRAGDGWRGGFLDLRRRALLGAAGRQKRAD